MVHHKRWNNPGRKEYYKQLEEASTTYKIEIIIFNGKKWYNNEPKDAICKDYSTCIHLFTRQMKKKEKNVNKLFDCTKVTIVRFGTSIMYWKIT